MSKVESNIGSSGDGGSAHISGGGGGCVSDLTYVARCFLALQLNRLADWVSPNDADGWEG